MIIVLFWICLCWPMNALSQKDSLGKAGTLRNNAYNGRTLSRPEILTSGFIDILNTGQVNASARLIRLLVGEPGKLAIPISVYSGVSSTNFQPLQYSGANIYNEQLGNNFINPLSGLANLSTEGILLFDRNKWRISNTGILYHAGLRVLTGYRNTGPADPGNGRPLNFLNSFGSGGMYFQTGAWEKNNARNLGICWIAGRYILCKSASSSLRAILPNDRHDGFYHGWSAGWGIEISNLVNIKLVYYKYVRSPGIQTAESIYQFSFTYSLK